VSSKTYTTKQAADAAGITRATLQAWIASGKFEAPAIQVRNGRAVRLWTPSDVAKLKAVKKEIYQEKRPQK
jgi:excisionase family DNA binding protein